jgi:outer membrane protein assembly factor BamD
MFTVRRRRRFHDDHEATMIARLVARLSSRDRSRRGLQALVIAAALFAPACASGPKKPPTGTPEPDKFLFERGTEGLTEKRWLTAREYFRELVDSYPQSRYRANAKLGVADTYLGERSAESFVLAANEFREFLSFYPTHTLAGYAQYKLGMTYYYQMRGPDRDQTETREAIKELSVFVERYQNDPSEPNRSLMPEAQQHLRDARDRLNDYEYRVGYHYFRTRWYPGAIDRFKVLLDRDPKYTRRDAVFYYLAESLLKIQRPAEALPYYDRLIAEFETSEYLEPARKRVSEIKEGVTTTKKGS